MHSRLFPFYDSRLRSCELERGGASYYVGHYHMSCGLICGLEMRVSLRCECLKLNAMRSVTLCPYADV
jgi:hypothetical protein